MRELVKPRDYFTLKAVNPIIRVFTLSDLLFMGGIGLMGPIFAVFVTGEITGGTVAVVGMAQAAFLLAKSLFQIPAAILIDAKKGEKDDFWAMIVAQVVCSLAPLAYLAIDTALELYLVQFVYGLAYAVLQPAWNAIYMRHIDRGHEGLESGIYFTITGLGAAAAASIGGYVAATYGFHSLFILVSIVSLLGTALLPMIYRQLVPGFILRPRTAKDRAI